MIFHNSFIAVFILLFMIEGIKGKRVINQVLETHREVCFAQRTLSRVSTTRPALTLSLKTFLYRNTNKNSPVIPWPPSISPIIFTHNGFLNFYLFC